MNISESLITGKGVTMSEALSMGGLTTVLGLGIVFAVLIVLMLVLYLFKVIFYKDPQKNEKVAKPKVAKSGIKKKEDEDELMAVITAAIATETENEDELMAVITAAVAASLNTSTYNLQIKSLRRIKDTRPAWNREGLRETIGNRF